jgi:predicted ATP-grasp superfamily ATP-dependent carboligase
VKIFVYEFVTSGGFLGDDEMPPMSLLAEGAAMLTALAEDFARLPDTSVCILRDHRIPLPELDCTAYEIDSCDAERELLLRLARQSDWTVVIAPEFNALLEQRARWVHEAGGRLLGPAPATIALAADKHQLATHLAAAGVPVPEGRFVEQGKRLPNDFGFPAVLKPNDGTGSLNVRLIRSADEARAIGKLPFDARLEKLIAGAPCSTAVLCGPKANHTLAPCRQHLSDDGRFHYLGGSLPLPQPLADRARRLAAAAIETLPSELGYIGVDLVLGDDASRDVVIEVNPRLTTSYVGLRAACRQNLAGVMLDVACGQKVDLRFDRRHLEFNASGQVFRR